MGLQEKWDVLSVLVSSDDCEIHNVPAEGGSHAAQEGPAVPLYPRALLRFLLPPSRAFKLLIVEARSKDGPMNSQML